MKSSYACHVHNITLFIMEHDFSANTNSHDFDKKNTISDFQITFI